MFDAGWLRHVSHVIQDDLRRKTVQQRFDGDDLRGVDVELHMPSDLVYGALAPKALRASSVTRLSATDAGNGTGVTTMLRVIPRRRCSSR